jgi:hypothetical protein
MSDHAAKMALFDGLVTAAKALSSGRRAEIIEVLAQGPAVASSSWARGVVHRRGEMPAAPDPVVAVGMCEIVSQLAAGGSADAIRASGVAAPILIRAAPVVAVGISTLLSLRPADLYCDGLSTGRSARAHSGYPSSRRAARWPRRRSIRTASSA